MIQRSFPESILQPRKVDFVSLSYDAIVGDEQLSMLYIYLTKRISLED